MYLVETKTILTEALRQSFNDSHRIPQFRDLHISIDYPVKQQDYPGVWVDFEPVGELRTVGIAHREYVLNEAGAEQGVTRWRFQGYATYTVAALSSLERDRLYDEVARVFASGREYDAAVAFRAYIEANPLIGMNIDFDEIEQRGHAASPGTPWQTDDIIYEATLALEVVGEFVTDLTGEVIRIDAINVQEYATHEPAPPWPV